MTFLLLCCLLPRIVSFDFQYVSSLIFYLNFHYFYFLFLCKTFLLLIISAFRNSFISLPCISHFLCFVLIAISLYFISVHEISYIFLLFVLE